MKKYRRHKRFWKIIRAIATPILKTMYKYSCEVYKDLKGPYLVLANHNTDLDPGLVALSFPQQMYFVASEHVYRAGFASKVLRYVFEQITASAWHFPISFTTVGAVCSLSIGTTTPRRIAAR